MTRLGYVLSCTVLAIPSSLHSQGNNVDASPIAIVRQVYEHFNQHDPAAMVALYADTMRVLPPDDSAQLVTAPLAGPGTARPMFRGS